MTITQRLDKSDLYYDRIEDQVDKLRSLPPDEQRHIRERMGWVEPGDLLEAEITVHCLVGADREFPRVTIRHHNGKWETIDIIKSVENNAVSIGHPAVLTAIWLWEQTVRYSKSTQIGDGQSPRERSIAGAYKLAKKHLERVGQALLKGANVRAISKAAVFAARTTEYDYGRLRLAWEILGTKEVKNIRNSDLQLSLLKIKMLNAIRERSIEGSNRKELLSPIVMEAVAQGVDVLIKFIRDERLNQKRRLSWRAM